MDKFAQRRGLLNKLHEWGNVSGRSAEKFFNPEFLKVMTALRLRDDTIRSIAAGEKIGDGDPGKDPKSMKVLLKSAKSNLARREYLQAASDLGRVHAKMAAINVEIAHLDGNVNEVHEQFIYKHLSTDRDNETPEEFQKRTEQLEHLKEMKKRLANDRKATMIKEAGIMDFFINIGTQRGRALAAWEKRYPGQTKALKDESVAQVAAAEKTVEITISTLKEMATARAARDVDSYMKYAGKITKHYTSYDTGFKAYYTKNIKGFLEKMFPEDPAVSEPAPKGPSVPAGEAKQEQRTSFEEPDPLTVKNPPMELAPDTERGAAPSHHDSIELAPDTERSMHEPVHEDVIELAPDTERGMRPPTLPPSSRPPSGPGGVSVVTDPSASPDGNTMPSPASIPRPARLPSGVPLHVAPSFSPMPLFPGQPANNNDHRPTIPGLQPPGRPTLMGVAPPANAPVSQPPASGVRITEAPPKSEQLAKEFGWSQTNHQNFYTALESMAGESPMILGAFISRYARKIQQADPETAINLLKIASRIKG